MTTINHIIVKIKEYVLRYETFRYPELNKLFLLIINTLRNIDNNRKLALELVNKLEKEIYND